MGAELTHSQAVNRIKDLYDEIDRLRAKDEGNGLNEEDQELFNELTREFEEVNEHRKALERKATAARVSAVREGLTREVIEGRNVKVDSGGDYDVDAILEPDSVPAARFKNPWDLSEVRTYARSPEALATELRARALSAVEKMAGANDGIRSAATRILEEFDEGSKIARMCLATSSPEYMRAWTKMAKGRESTITQEERTALERAMSLTDNAGGYLVPFQIDPTVIISSNGSRNEIRRVARQVVATGDVWNGVSAGAVAWSWDSEGAQVSDDAPTFASPNVPIHKAAGFVPISIEAAQDAANVTQEIGRLLAVGKDILEAQAFATGTGEGQPKGIVTALAGTAAEVDSAGDEVFAIGDVYALDSALPARFRANASWLANRGIYNLIRQFDTEGGAGLWERIGNGLPPNLLGRPALEAEAMASTIATGEDTLPLIYGDFEHYVIADRIGFTVEFIPHLFQQTTAGTGFGRPTGQRGWYAHYRVGANVTLAGAFRMLKVTEDEG